MMALEGHKNQLNMENMPANFSWVSKILYGDLKGLKQKYIDESDYIMPYNS